MSALPANIDAEKTILGAILLDNAAHAEAAERLEPEDFLLDSHKRIFLRMSQLIKKRHAVDIVTLSESLTQRKEIQSVGGVAYLASLTEGLPMRPVIENYIRIVKDKSLLRSLLSMCSEGMQRVRDTGAQPAEIGALLSSRLTSLAENGTHGATPTPMTREEASRITSELLDQCQAWISRYIILSNEQAIVLAAWILHTYVFDVPETTPYIHITAPVLACGKSRLMETLEAIAAEPIRSGGMTAAALVRTIEAKRPTIFLDEMDAQLGGDKEFAEAVRGILNEGFRKGGVFYKCVGKDFELKGFRVYCPKCFAGIGDMPNTVSSRCIVIEMRRKLPGEIVEPFRQRAVKSAAAPIKKALKTWADRGADDLLQGIEPAAILSLNDRQNDIAEPLLAIAQLAGEQQIQSLTSALKAILISPGKEESSIGATLLADVRAVFDDHNGSRIPSKVLAERLCEIEGRPWAEWSKGKGLSANNLARQLKKFKVYPDKIRFGKPAQGYSREDFEDAWKRYCPLPTSISTGTSEHPASPLAETAFSNRNTYASVPVKKNDSNPHEHRSVPVVPVEKQGRGNPEVRV